LVVLDPLQVQYAAENADYKQFFAVGRADSTHFRHKTTAINLLAASNYDGDCHTIICHVLLEGTRMHNFRVLWLVLPLLSNACNCQPTAASAATRIVIGFDEGITDPASELTASLSKELDCELQPLHALGGNAYVYNCTTSDTEAALTRKLHALNQHKGVRYAEIDRIRKIQN
jgi:hypothetical protein